MNKRCQTKKRFCTEEEAQRVLHRIRSIGSNHHHECRVYLCGICFGYHLTSQEKRKK